jgi:hypothetical protein
MAERWPSKIYLERMHGLDMAPKHRLDDAQRPELIA